MRIGFVGGTGPAGRGLAARFARAEHAVLIGSRSPERAAGTSASVEALVPAARVEAASNEQAAGADAVFLTVPPDAQVETVRGLAGHLAGRVVVSMANPLRVERPDAVYEPPPQGSLAEASAAAAPAARWVSAFHEIRLDRFARLDRPIEADTLVCGDDEDAKRVIIDLAHAIEGLRAIDAGPLRNARHLEGFVAVLIAINFRYRAGASYRITGV